MQFAHLSLKAHFFAVLETLTNVVYQDPPGVVTSMKLWFERTLVMAYKVMSFGVNPRPQNLRLLNCLRFFEKVDDNRPGYSFVYQVPELMSRIGPHEHTLTALLHLLLSAKKAMADPHMNQPVLGDKFRLASALAGFLVEFHSIG